MNMFCLVCLGKLRVSLPIFKRNLATKITTCRWAFCFPKAWEGDDVVLPMLLFRLEFLMLHTLRGAQMLGSQASGKVGNRLMYMHDFCMCNPFGLIFRPISCSLE
jgi:hypothetical protein